MATLNAAAAVIAQSREDRLSELADAAVREQYTADALDALAELILYASVPVARYEDVWRVVHRRLRNDAAEARRRAHRAASRLEDVRHAIEARATQQ